MRAISLEFVGPSARRVNSSARYFRLTPGEIYAGEDEIFVSSYQDGVWWRNGSPFREARFTAPVMVRVGSTRVTHGPYYQAHLAGRVLYARDRVLAVVAGETAWRWGHTGLRYPSVLIEAA